MDGLKVKELINYQNILNIYEKEICKNVKHKDKLKVFERNKVQNINTILNILNSNTYDGGKYEIFLISEPKLRIVMSLRILDKIINHFTTRFILEPKLTKYLDDRNIATRKGMGTDYGIRLIKKYLEMNKKYGTFYSLKIDISKYFYSINHEVLFNMLKYDLDDDEYRLVKSIINSTNKDYINKQIIHLKEMHKVKYHNRLDELNNIPLYFNGKGLPIGNLTSQFLSIYYLNRLDHYIIHDLKIKCYLRYMDDFILIHHDKEYLKYSLFKIKSILNNEYKLDINLKKTQISNIKHGFTILGYRFRVINNKTIINIKKDTKNRIKRKVKENKYLLDKNINNYNHVFSSINNYYYSYKYSDEAREIVDKYFWGS